MAPVTPVRAQAPQQAGDRHIDVVGERHQVSGGFGDWTGLAVRLTVPAGASDVWFVEALQRKAFTDVGAYVSGALQHRWNDRWHSFVSVGAGTGEFILPDLRVDASLSRKWGARGALVTTLGTTLVDAKLGYRDAGGYGLLTAYLAPAVVAEAGVRVMRSMPGSVDAARALGAVTLGRTGKAYVVVRGSSGEEGYQLLGPGAVERRFTSREGAVSWRQWLGRAGGFLVQGERYTNPFYKRTGVSVGIFAHW
ncbi:MAG: YaiO family outer membrane beta-barrel protein [Gemmatimonadaceae bacterium]